MVPAGRNDQQQLEYTNNIHYSYLELVVLEPTGRPVQISGLGGALEPLGEPECRN